ncbi:MAG: hypothetical protein ACTFAL_02480 [Candidatus Electronema sp. V4]|uniref:hypothetical protein n=1 Tax=Candidatus Electronema sp. V4 TaxID=3454756 RepID=UPI0040555C1B
MKGKGKLPGWLLAAGILLASASADVMAADQNCGVYSSSPGAAAAGRRYRSCEDCLSHSRRCEERCTESGYVCTAAGYGHGRRERLNRVRGESAERERGARRNALRLCQEQGLRDCVVEHCVEEQQRERTQPCRRNADSSSGIGWSRPQHDSPAVVPSAPAVPFQPPQRYVVSWQHVKESCQGQPYHKIAEQCGNRVPFWQGIRCQVTWSDGRTENLGGKVDLTDPYGRRYCTRDSRPASFNCVSRCDNSPGPLINLPRP